MKEGYWCGYESGHKDGIQKALEIPDEDLSDMSERATEMEIDEMIIKGMDERKGKS
ncbi:MAG: hypothetical protein HZA22_12590 [Nitrospirae bacterium]|nr:hypothetical protein [Nitrospirota bacterium]